MSKILKNTTASNISLSVLGLPSIPAGNQIEIQAFDYVLLASDDSITYLSPLITSGDVVVNDGVTDLSAARGIDYIRWPDRAFGVRFEAQPERPNGFIAKNTQDAIEELNAKVTGKPRAILTFGYNGNAGTGRWLEIHHSNSSNTSPYVAAESGKIKALSISCKNPSTVTASLFVNGIPTDTIALSSSHTAFKTNLNHALNLNAEVSIQITAGSASEPIVFVSLEVNL